MVTKKQLKEMNEAFLRTEVLIPLFKAMGFKDVLHYHGSMEHGKDIVMWKEDKLKNRENYAVVVKAKRITGQKADVSEVRTEIEQCFESPYTDQPGGPEQQIRRCYVVSSHEIIKEATAALNPVLKSQNWDKIVTFISGDELWELIKEYLKEKAYGENIANIQKISDSMSPYYRFDTHILDGKVATVVKEKYPGASLEHPITISGKIITPDTPEGKKVRESLKAFHTKGTPFEVGGDFIEGFEFPSFITDITGPQGELSMLRLESRPPEEPLTVRVDVIPTDGESFSLGYVELIRERVGTEEAFLTNEKQKMPIKCNLTLNVPAKNARIDFQCEFENLNVKQVYDCLCLQNALSKHGAIIITTTADGLELFNFPIKERQFEPPSENWLLLLEALVFIQTKAKRQITFPTREIAPEEANTVIKVKHILTTGQTNGTWDSFTVNPDRNGVENFLNHVKNAQGQASPLVLETEETVEIFGTEIPLGPIRIYMEQAAIENETEELEQFLETASQMGSLQLRFKPHGSNRATTSYTNWQATAEESAGNHSNDAARINGNEFLFRRKISGTDKEK